MLEKLLQDLRTYSGPHEIIVSDGNSTDGTIDIAQRLADQVVIYRGTQRQTIGQGRNMGAAVARGEFLLFLDADVHIPDPDEFLAQALRLFHDDPKLVAITPRIRVFPETEDFGDRFLSRWLTMVNALQNNVLGIGAGSGEFQMVRAEAFRVINGYNERLVASEDYNLIQRLSRRGRTRYIHSLVVFHSGRRAHAIGWFKLLGIWAINTIMALLFGRAMSREWKEIR